MLAKHRDANRRLAGMFERGEVDKGYVAIVYGRVADGEDARITRGADGEDARITRDADGTAIIDAPIAKVDARYQYPVEYEYGKAHDRATYLPKRIVAGGGKPARTRFEVIRHVALPSAGADERPREATVLRVTPEHGRTNQIRVHLAHIGHPIVGDKIYALTGGLHDEVLREGLTPRVRAALVLDRHALHGETLAFAHPFDGRPLSIRAGLPEDMRSLAESGMMPAGDA
jgi:23S rRNA-/tRNA-specific pseudouridylate synthase